jgi:4-amino-4-deoxy-L-arabinose transferase-like glycosyltransferase
LNLRNRIPDWILLLAFCAFFFLWRLAAFGLISADEPRYAQVAREMLAHHDWVTPILGGAPWLEKPPLYYWQAMLAYRIFGASDWAARLPSVFDATLLVFAAYWLLRRLRREAALDGALMLACSAGIVGYTRAASMDMPLTVTFVIAMMAWYAWLENGSRLHLAYFYGLLALAMLAKGPVAPFLAAVIIVIFAAVQRDFKIVPRTLWIPGILLFCTVALPWYVLVQLRNPQFFRFFILEHNLARFDTNVFHHPEPFWYYVPVALLGWVPWTVFVVVAMVWAIRKFRTPDRDSFNTFLVIWIAVVVFFFSISQSKLPGYVLPALPPGIFLLTSYVQAKIPARSHSALSVLHALVCGGLVFAALAAPSVLVQHRLRWNSTLTTPLMASLVVAVAEALLTLKTGFRSLRATTIVAVVALAFAIRVASASLDETLSARPVSEVLSRLAPRQLPVALVMVPRETEYGLRFYRNQEKMPRYEYRQAPAGEHLVVAAQGFRVALAGDVPGRRVVYLGNFPAQKLEFFYVGP